MALLHSLTWRANDWGQLTLLIGASFGGVLWLSKNDRWNAMLAVFWGVLTLIGLLLDFPLGSAAPILAVYKRQLVASGRITFCRGWGWIDRKHSLADVLQKLQNSRSSAVDLEHWFFGGWGRDYALLVQGPCRTSREVRRCLQLLGERCEREEAQLPWYYGSRLSAYHGDDLPSVYLTLFCHAFPNWTVYLESTAESQARMRREGPGWTTLRVASSQDFQPRDPSLRARYQELFGDLENLPSKVRITRKGPILRPP